MFPRSTKPFRRGKRDKISTPKTTEHLLETQFNDTYDDATLHQKAELPRRAKHSDMSKNANSQEKEFVTYRNTRSALPPSKIPIRKDLKTGLNSRSSSEHNLNKVGKNVKFDSKPKFINVFNSNECRFDKHDKTNMHLPIKKPANVKNTVFTHNNITKNDSTFGSKINFAPIPDSKKTPNSKKNHDSKKTPESKKIPESTTDHEYKAVSVTKKSAVSKTYIATRTPSKTDSKEEKKQKEIETVVSQTPLSNRNITKQLPGGYLKSNIHGLSETEEIGSLENIPSSLLLSKTKKEKCKTLSVNDLSTVNKEIDFHVKTGYRWIKPLNVPISEKDIKGTTSKNLNTFKKEENVQHEEHNFENENTIPILKKDNQGDNVFPDNSEKQSPKNTGDEILNGKDDVFLPYPSSEGNTSSTQVTEIIPQTQVTYITPNSQVVETTSGRKVFNIESAEQFPEDDLDSQVVEITSGSQEFDVECDKHFPKNILDSQVVQITSGSHNFNIECEKHFSKNVLDSQVPRIIAQSQNVLPESQVVKIVPDNQVITPDNQYSGMVPACRVDEITVNRASAEITPDSQAVGIIQGKGLSNTVTSIYNDSIIPTIQLADSAVGSQILPDCINTTRIESGRKAAGIVTYSQVHDIIRNSQVDGTRTDKHVAGIVEDNFESLFTQNKTVLKENIESSKIKHERLSMKKNTTPEKWKKNSTSCTLKMITPENRKQVKHTTPISTEKIKRLSATTNNEVETKSVGTKALMKKVLIKKPLTKNESIRMLAHQILKGLSDLSNGTNSFKQKKKLKDSPSADKYFSDNASKNFDENNCINEIRSVFNNTEESNNSSNVSHIPSDKEQNAFQTTTVAGSPISKTSSECQIQATKQSPICPRIVNSSKISQCPVKIPSDSDLKTEKNEQGIRKDVSEFIQGLKDCCDAEKGFSLIKKAFSYEALFQTNEILESADDQAETKHNTERESEFDECCEDWGFQVIHNPVVDLPKNIPVQLAASNENKSFTFAHTGKNYVGDYNDITDGETQRGSQNLGKSVELEDSCQTLGEEQQTNKRQTYNGMDGHNSCSSGRGELTYSRETEMLVKENSPRCSTSRKLFITSLSLLIMCTMIFLYVLSCS